MAWQLGHLVASECSLLNGIRPGAAPELPADFADQHGKESTLSDDPAKFGSKQQYLDLTEQVHAATLALLDSYPESDFSLPSPESFRSFFRRWDRCSCSSPRIP